MVNDSKILTVSYGTFSCTLEGFDDPFSTMKDIAEYFRDLAAQDRYFGAEPPTPDTAMLQRIAEQNSRSSVSAEMGDNAVTLRPAQAPIVTTTPLQEAAETVAEAAPEGAASIKAEAPAAVEVTEPEIEVAAQEHAATELAEDTVTEDTPETVEVAEVEEDVIEIIEAETTEAEVTEEVAIEDDAAEIEAEITQAYDGEDVTFDEVATEEDDIPNLAAITAAADLNDGQDEVAHAHTPETQTDGASVVDRLALIRQAVADDGGEDGLGTFEQTYSEDQHADVVTQSAEDTIAALLADDELAGENMPLDDMSDDLDAPLVLAADDIVEDNADDLAIAAAMDAEDEINDWDADAAEQLDEEMLGEDPFEDTEEVDAADAETDVQEQDLEEAVAQDAADADAQEDKSSVLVPMPLRAIVKRIRRAPTEVPSAPLESTFEDDAADMPADVIASELGLDDAAGPEDEADVERLFEMTKDKFEGEETSRAHANISHLKAAVAARKADSDEMADMAKTEEVDPYREDLANAVKPSRPRRVAKEGEAARTERPISEPIVPGAPLVLISEQRVDENGNAAPAVQPRRVRRAMDESFEADSQTLASVAAAAGDKVHLKTKNSEFKAFAEDAGVTDLVDILEAAAAYCQLERRLESFSRPKLLHLAQEVDEEFSREEGLRGFGQLLRSGTIKKIKRGSFELARTSRFIETVKNRAAG